MFVPLRAQGCQGAREDWGLVSQAQVPETRGAGSQVCLPEGHCWLLCKGSLPSLLHVGWGAGETSAGHWPEPPAGVQGVPLPAVASLGDGHGLRAPAGSLQPPGHADGHWLFVRIRGLDGCRPPTRGSELDTALDAVARPAVAQGAETLLPMQAS